MSRLWIIQFPTTIRSCLFGVPGLYNLFLILYETSVKLTAPPQKIWWFSSSESPRFQSFFFKVVKRLVSGRTVRKLNPSNLPWRHLGFFWDVRCREFQAMRNRDLKRLRAQDGWTTENFHEENRRWIYIKFGRHLFATKLGLFIWYMNHVHFPSWSFLKLVRFWSLWTF